MEKRKAQAQMARIRLHTHAVHGGKLTELSIIINNEIGYSCVDECVEWFWLISFDPNENFVYYFRDWNWKVRAHELLKCRS